MITSKNVLISCILLSIQLNVPAQTGTDYNLIDGFTSPSKRHSLRIDSIELSRVYRTRAELRWWEYYKDDNDVLVYTFMWGTDSGQYTDTLNLQPYQEETWTTITLDNLTENTEYYGEFYRDYKGKLFNVRFRFNTPPLPTVSPVYDTTARVGCRVPPFSIRTEKESISSIEIFSIDGRRLRGMPVEVPSRVPSAVQPALVPGMYIINLLDAENRLIKSDKLLVGN